MRCFIIIAVLSALTACYGASVFPGEEVPQWNTVVYDDMSPEGRVLSEAESRNEGWPLLSQFYCLAPAVPNEQQRVTVSYKGSSVIRRISINWPASLPRPDVSYTPLGFNYMIVNITSQPDFQVDSVVQLNRWPDAWLP